MMEDEERKVQDAIGTLSNYGISVVVNVTVPVELSLNKTVRASNVEEAKAIVEKEFEGLSSEKILKKLCTEYNTEHCDDEAVIWMRALDSDEGTSITKLEVIPYC